MVAKQYSIHNKINRIHLLKNKTNYKGGGSFQAAVELDKVFFLLHS